MAAKRKTLSLILLAIAILAAPAAVAHVQPNQALHPTPIDFRYELPESSGSQPFTVFTDPKLHLFADVAGVELPRPSISTRLERNLRGIELATTSRVSEKRTSGLRGSLEKAIVNQLSDLRPKTWWGDDFARQRWYDPTTGNFVSPDPLGYRDSANLYAFAGGDPVNHRDPTGKGMFTDLYKAAAKELLNPHNGVLERATFGVLAVAETLPAGAEQLVETIIDTPSRVWRNSGGVSQQIIATTKAKDTDSRLRHASAALGHGSQLLLDATVVGGTVESALARQAEKDLAESALRGLSQADTEVVVEPEAAEAETLTENGSVNLLRPKTLQPRPDGITFGPPRGGGGKAPALAYARNITQAEKSIYLKVPGLKNPVEFDAVVNRTLIDAKAAGQIKPRSIYDLTSDVPFIRQKSRQIILEQSERQLIAGEYFSMNIEWRIADKRMADAVAEFFAERQIPITVRYVPAP